MMKRTLLLILVLAPLAACASAQAKSRIERPNLDVPPPPPPPVGPAAAAGRAAPPKTEPPVEQPAAASLPQLRTPNSPDAARQVQEIIDRASATLRSIDYRVLNNERRAQYDNAKLLARQAGGALNAGNFDFAKNLADKAERIAKELQGR